MRPLLGRTLTREGKALLARKGQELAGSDLSASISAKLNRIVEPWTKMSKAADEEGLAAENTKLRQENEELRQELEKTTVALDLAKAQLAKG